jgi:hypothetical protein
LRVKIVIGLEQEIPSQIRDFAEKSVEQAREAFLGFMARRAEGYERNGVVLIRRQGRDDEGHVICGRQRQSSPRPRAEARPRQGRQESLALQTVFAKSQVAVMQTQVKELGAMARGAPPRKPRIRNRLIRGSSKRRGQP